MAMNPPSGSPRTELRPIGSGATAQPIHVSVGVCGFASSSNTSTDFAAAMDDDEELWTELRPSCRYKPCVRNFALNAASGGPGQVDCTSSRRDAPCGADPDTRRSTCDR